MIIVERTVSNVMYGGKITRLAETSLIFSCG